MWGFFAKWIFLTEPHTGGSMDLGTNLLGHTGVCDEKSKNPLGHRNPSLVTQYEKVESK